MFFFDPQLGVVGAYTRLALLGLPRPGAIALPLGVMATTGATLGQTRQTPGARRAPLGSMCYLGRVLAPENMASVLGDLNNHSLVALNHLARLLGGRHHVPLKTIAIKPSRNLRHNDVDVRK